MRKAPLVAAIRVRSAACPRISVPLSEAASLRARCVFTQGWPVLSVHLSLGFAPDTGQGTDKICLSDTDFKMRHASPTSQILPSAFARGAVPEHADSWLWLPGYDCCLGCGQSRR